MKDYQFHQPVFPPDSDSDSGEEQEGDNEEEKVISYTRGQPEDHEMPKMTEMNPLVERTETEDLGGAVTTTNFYQNPLMESQVFSEVDPEWEMLDACVDPDEW